MMRVHQVIKPILTNNIKPAIAKDLLKQEDKLHNQKMHQILSDN